MKLTKSPISSLKIAALAMAALSIAFSSAAQADATWITTTGAAQTWSVGANWDSGTAPGATSGTTNTDTATFNSPSVNQAITVDANRNLQNFVFNLNSGTFGYTIQSAGVGNSALILSNNGSATLNATNSADLEQAFLQIASEMLRLSK